MNINPENNDPLASLENPPLQPTTPQQTEADEHTQIASVLSELVSDIMAGAISAAEAAEKAEDLAKVAQKSSEGATYTVENKGGGASSIYIIEEGEDPNSAVIIEYGTNTLKEEDSIPIVHPNPDAAELSKDQSIDSMNKSVQVFEIINSEEPELDPELAKRLALEATEQADNASTNADIAGVPPFDLTEQGCTDPRLWIAAVLDPSVVLDPSGNLREDIPHGFDEDQVKAIKEYRSQLASCGVKVDNLSEQKISKASHTDNRSCYKGDDGKNYLQEETVLTLEVGGKAISFKYTIYTDLEVKDPNESVKELKDQHKAEKKLNNVFKRKLLRSNKKAAKAKAKAAEDSLKQRNQLDNRSSIDSTEAIMALKVFKQNIFKDIGGEEIDGRLTNSVSIGDAFKNLKAQFREHKAGAEKSWTIDLYGKERTISETGREEKTQIDSLLSEIFKRQIDDLQKSSRTEAKRGYNNWSTEVNKLFDPEMDFEKTPPTSRQLKSLEEEIQLKDTLIKLQDRNLYHLQNFSSNHSEIKEEKEESDTKKLIEKIRLEKANLLNELEQAKEFTEKYHNYLQEKETSEGANPLQLRSKTTEEKEIADRITASLQNWESQFNELSKPKPIGKEGSIIPSAPQPFSISLQPTQPIS